MRCLIMFVTAVCVLFLLKLTYIETLLLNGNRSIIDMSDGDLMKRKIVRPSKTKCRVM